MNYPSSITAIMRSLTSWFLFVLLHLNVQIETVFGSGLSLHCVNRHNWRDWHWAPGTESQHGSAVVDTLSDVDEQLATAYDRGVWIFGTPSLNTYFHLLLKITKDGHPHYFQSEAEAFQFCSKLRKLCTDSFGSEYVHIGAGTDYYIGIAFINANEALTFSSCPNYNDPGFPNTSGKPVLYPAALRRFQSHTASVPALHPHHRYNYKLQHRSRG